MINDPERQADLLVLDMLPWLQSLPGEEARNWARRAEIAADNIRRRIRAGK